MKSVLWMSLHDHNGLTTSHSSKYNHSCKACRSSAKNGLDLNSEPSPKSCITSSLEMWPCCTSWYTESLNSCAISCRVVCAEMCHVLQSDAYSLLQHQLADHIDYLEKKQLYSVSSHNACENMIVIYVGNSKLQTTSCNALTGLPVHFHYRFAYDISCNVINNIRH